MSELILEKEIAIIGTTEVIKPFAALGIACYEIHQPAAALQLLAEIEQTKKTAIVLIAEALAEKILPELNRLKAKTEPAVFILPDYGSTKNIGLRALEKTMARAVGQKI